MSTEAFILDNSDATEAVNIEDVLYVIIMENRLDERTHKMDDSERKLFISELETEDSLKIKLAANLPLADCDYPLCDIETSIPPNLLNLEEIKDDEKKSKDSRLDLQISVHGGRSQYTCSAIRIDNPLVAQINPLAMRKYRLRNFANMSYVALTAALRVKNSNEFHLRTADELIEIFSIPDRKSYVKYIMLFTYDRLSEAEQSSFRRAVESTLGISSFTIVRSSIASWTQELESELTTVKNQAIRDSILFNGYADKMRYEPIPSTTVRLNETSVLVKFQMETDIYELFNGLTLSSLVPFCAIGNFFKVLKTFKPPMKWATQYAITNAIVMYVLNRRSEPEKNKIKADAKNYSTIFIIPKETNALTHQTSIDMEIVSRVDDELKQVDLFQRIFEIFAIPVSNCTYEELRIDADYLIPANDEYLIPPLFHDMVMTDPVVSQLMLINESKRLVRERGGIFSDFRWNSSGKFQERLSCRIQIGTTEAAQQARLTSNGEPLLDIGQPYLQVKLFKCASQPEVIRFQQVINQIIAYYYHHREELKIPYENIFGEIRANVLLLQHDKVKADGPRRKLLRHDDPIMFPKGYQRFCRYAPRMISATEAKAEEAKGKDVMYYPRPYNPDDDKRNIEIESCRDSDTPKVNMKQSDIVPHHYICDNKAFPYVGLKLNTLPNRNIYPLLPCCYPVPQKTNHKRLRYRYENPDEEYNISAGARRGNKRKLFLTNKAMRRGEYAVLPELVDRLLITVTIKAFPVFHDRPSYLRKGTIRDRNSVLDAIITAILDYETVLTASEEPEAKTDSQGYKDLLESKMPILKKIWNGGYDSMTDTDRCKYLISIRKAMASLIPTNITAQSSYNFELVAISDLLTADQSYLDPRIVWRLLEEIFNVELFLFQRNVEYPEGVLGAPLFLQEYLRLKRPDQEHRISVILFETSGGEFDHLDYPQIELIEYFTYDDSGDVERNDLFFKTPGDAKFLARLQTCFDEIYSYDGQNNRPFINVFESKPIGQCADYYGKIRLLQFPELCIITEPLPALDPRDIIPRVDPSCALVNVPLRTAQRFLQRENVAMEDLQKITIPNPDGRIMLIGLQCKKETNDPSRPYISFYIPVEPSPDITKLPNSNVLAPSFYAKESLLDQFGNIARTVRYVIEYVVWIFSRWYHANNGELDELYDIEPLRKFVEVGFELDPRTIYPTSIPRRLDIALPGLMKNKKVRVASVEIRNRLIYALQIRIKQNSKDVFMYYNRKFIDSYYQDISDFTPQNSTILLYGIDMVTNWIEARLPHYTLRDKLILDLCSDAEIEAEDAEDEDEESKEEKEDDSKNANQEDEEKGNREDEEDKKGDETQDDATVKVKDNNTRSHRLKMCATKKGQMVIPPYFIRLEELGPQIYIAQQARDMPHAMFITQTWDRQHSNPGYESVGSADLDMPFRYVMYQGTDNIEMEYPNGEGGNLTILQYMYKENTFTVALLPFK